MDERNSWPESVNDPMYAAKEEQATDAPDLSAANVVKTLRTAAAKFRSMGREFSGPRFTDRHGDGPVLLAHAETLDIVANALDALPIPCLECGELCPKCAPHTDTLAGTLDEIRAAAEAAGWSSHAPIAAFITEQQQRLADLRAAVRKWDAAVHGDGWPASVFPVVAEADATLLSTVADMDAPPPLPTDCPECGHAHAMHFPLKAGCAVYGCDCTSKVYMTEDQ